MVKLWLPEAQRGGDEVLHVGGGGQIQIESEESEDEEFLLEYLGYNLLPSEADEDVQNNVSHIKELIP